MVMALRTVASVTFGMFAGVVADNFDRRTVMIVTKVLVLGLSIIFAAILVFGQIEVWHFYLFTLLRGVTMAFDQPARRAMIPSIVPAHLITNAMTLSTGSMQVMRIVGATAAGFLIGFAGVEAAFVTIAVVYVLAVIFTLMLRVVPQKRRGERSAKSMGRDLVEGFKYAWKTPDIRGVLIIALGYFAFAMSFMQVFSPLFATQIMDIGASGFGFMMAVAGAGGVLGSLVLATLSPSTHRGMIMMGTLAAVGALLVAFSASTYLDTVLLTFGVIAVLGFTQSMFMPLVNTSILHNAPDEMRGRMMGLISMDRALTAFGGAIAGFSAAALGPQVAQIIFGVACVVTAFIMFVAYPSLKRIN